MGNTALEKEIEELASLKLTYINSLFSNKNLGKEAVRRGVGLVKSLEQTDLQIIENYINARVKNERLKGLASLATGALAGFFWGESMGGGEITSHTTFAGFCLGSYYAIDSFMYSTRLSKLKDAIINEFYSRRIGLTESIN
jgi:hypothetical protein